MNFRFQIIIVCLGFLMTNCDNKETNSNAQGLIKGKRSLLTLENQDTADLSMFYADSAYCVFLELNHQVSNKFLTKYQMNDKLLMFTNKMINNNFESNLLFDSINILNDKINFLIQKFDYNYPYKQGELSFGEYCHGYCEPRFRDFGIPVLPDRMVDVQRYWRSSENQQTLTTLIRDLKICLHDFALMIGVEDFRFEEIYKGNAPQIENIIKNFRRKTTSESILILANIQEDFCKIKKDLLIKMNIHHGNVPN